MFNLNIDLLKPVINGSLLVGAEYGVDYFQKSVSGHEMKKLGIDFAIMASSTLVNELVVNMVTLPSFLQSLKNLYGVDLLTVIMFVAFKYMFNSDNGKDGLIKDTIIATAVILGSNYVETPIRPYAPSWLLPKV